MQICADFWEEYMRWAVPFAKVKSDADIYDVFIWIREHLQGASPYSASFLAKIDKEIERELGPWK